MPARLHERPRKQDNGSATSGERILRLPDVENALYLKKWAIYKLIKIGAFPDTGEGEPSVVAIVSTV